MIWLYKTTQRSVGQEVADQLYPGVRQYVAKLKVGIEEQAYVPAGPDRDAIDPSMTTKNSIEVKPPPSQG